MKITFILVGSAHNPVCGFKVAYEYANRLTQRGHDVTIIHPSLYKRDSSLYWRTIKSIRYAQRALLKSYSPKKWFTLDPKINLLWVSSLDKKNIPHADAIIATAWQTAEWVASYPASRGKKFYLIQHWENWNCTDSRLKNTWKLPLHKIVISRWLKEISDKLEEDCTYIPNGLDHSAFYLDTPINSRDPQSILMLSHKMTWKGTNDGLNALHSIKEEFPQANIDLFGVENFKKKPTWVNYHKNPTQEQLRSLYNKASIFIAPSWSEGWGLPACEAMMCGSALVATDIDGHREFTNNGTNALLSPPRNSEKMADNIKLLISDNEYRVSIAKAGNKSIQKFDWGLSCDMLEATLLQKT